VGTWFIHGGGTMATRRELEVIEKFYEKVRKHFETSSKTGWGKNQIVYKLSELYTDFLGDLITDRWEQTR
jgi:hypothetical protein